MDAKLGKQGGPLAGEARLRYGDGDIEVLKDGSFVVCAVTGRRIRLDELRYWSVDHQEAYADAEAALARWKQTGRL